MGEVIRFHDPSLPLTGNERLVARRAYRKGCRAVATVAVAHAFSVAAKLPGVDRLGCDDVLPIFVAAMRRELRKTGIF
jgi:hypothetical protein